MLKGGGQNKRKRDGERKGSSHIDIHVTSAQHTYIQKRRKETETLMKKLEGIQLVNIQMILHLIMDTFSHIKQLGNY